MNVCVREILRTHLGQGLVHFVHAHDRDLMVNHSPDPYGGVDFTVVRHNQGRNWRAMQFNRVLVNVVGFPARLLEPGEYSEHHSFFWQSNTLGK
jgi:hypothetical protein